MNYFAYGSNMLHARLRAASRAPSAAPVCAAMLAGHVLRFHKRGRDGSGKCMIDGTNRPHGAVYGMLFNVDGDDIGSLDRAEGCHRGGYTRRHVTVRPLDEGVEVGAETYYAGASFVNPSLVPFAWYKALVVAGAIEHGLPPAYISALRAAPSILDDDDHRRTAALAFLG